MKEILYPSPELIIQFNALAITMFETKKADSSKLLSYTKLLEAIEKCKKTEGDIYDKAAVLLIELVKAHAFASGNRRTAFITTKDFIKKNKAKFNIKDDPTNAKILTGVREGYYKTNEIKEWIKNGKIRKFER
ncbi:MAG: type II toxin-antitoxin system death-on-curing family toxin [Candidatus Woesearchaeota archaeon]